MQRQPQRRHLIDVAADVERTSGDPAGVERGEQRVVVDEVAARRVHEEGARLHARERRGIHEVLGLRRCHGEADDEVGAPDGAVVARKLTKMSQPAARSISSGSDGSVSL